MADADARHGRGRGSPPDPRDPTRERRVTAAGRRSSTLPAVLLAAGVGFVISTPAATAGGQSWRTLEVSRPDRDSAPIVVRLSYGAGTLALRPTAAPLLYHAELRYDGSRAEAIHSYDPATRLLQLGTRQPASRLHREGEAGEFRLEFGRRVPVDLGLDLGAVEATLDLSGIDVQRLRLQSGASAAAVRFDSANAVAMRSLELTAGVASLRADQLANANAREISVHAGVGSVDLDVGGRWTQDIDLRVDVTLGAITVRVPRDVGVRLEVDRLVADIDAPDLTKRRDAYYSADWDRAPHRLRIKAQTLFGRISLERAEP